MDPQQTTIPDIDAAPVRLSGRDDVEAFVTSAYGAHHGEIYGFLVRSTRDASVAEDLLQETFLRLTREARRGRPPQLVRAWLFRVASNLAIERSRRQATVRRWLGRLDRGEPAAMTAPSPEIGVLRRERAAAMDLILAGLSADARLALLLSSEGFAGEEIAAAIGRSDAATRALLCRSRARLRQGRELEAEAE